jgi:uncharacterized protein (TIGR03000 family)
MNERTMRVRWGRGLLPAGMLALALSVGAGLPARSASGPLDLPVSAEPRVPAAKCLTFPGLGFSKGLRQPFHRVDKDDTLYTRDLLVVIPGLKVTLEPLGGGLTLTLWGNLPGLSDSPVLESSVILHDTKAYDLDFTLVRGRVVLTNEKKKGPVKVWLRMKRGVELELPEPGDSVALELYGRWPAGVPFSLKRRPGVEPVQLWEVNCLKGRLQIKAGDTEWGMAAPPGRAFFHGDSIDGPNPSGPEARAKLPEWADPSVPPSPTAKAVQAVVKAYTGSLKDKDDPEAARALALELAAKDKNKVRASMVRQLVVYSLAAQDEVGQVAEMLNTSPSEDIRKAAVQALRAWIGGAPGRDERLWEVLQDQVGFNKNEAEAVLQLLHSPFAKDQPETYETLIAYLRHRRQAVRELAAWHLYRLAPAGRKIPFDAGGSSAAREKAIEAWRKLIPSGELPKEPGDDTKDKDPEKPKVKVAPRGKETPKPSEAPPKAKPGDGEKPRGKAHVQPAAPASAYLLVKLVAEATLLVDGEPTTQTGAERLFVTPPLKPGVRYHYVLSATWPAAGAGTVTRTRKAYVEAGKTTEMDLRTEDPAQPDKIARPAEGKG